MELINALVVKLVDTKDLKSLPFWECQFEPAEGTTSMINNLQILRAFAAINVVYLHVLIGSQSYGKPTLVFPYVGEWGANGVDIFL